MSYTLVPIVVVLVTVGISKPVFAADKIHLDLNGSSRWWGGYLSDRHNSHARIMGENEIHFSGETALDNGTVVGVQSVIEQKTDEDTPDHLITMQYLHIYNGFGSFQLGLVDSLAGTQIHVTAPEATGDVGTGRFLRSGYHKHGLDDGTHVPFTTALDTTDNDTRINYLSPTFGGTAFAMDFSSQQIVNLGVYHTSEIQDAHITAAAAWAHSLDNRGQEFNAGFQLAYDSWIVGASARRTLATTARSTAWDAGIMKTSGPWSISLYRFEGGINRDNARIALYQLGARRTLSPGVAAMATAGHINYRDLGQYLDWSGRGWRVLAGMEMVF